MKEKNNFEKNIVFSLLYQLLAACSSFILPQSFIKAYGSAINGSISTILQITSFWGLLEAGMGSVASVAFYKALAENAVYDLTTVRNTIRRYYRIIGGISVAICTLLSLVLPLLLKNGQTFSFNFELVIIISCGYFIQYYMGITSQLLLSAAYKAYINSIAQISALILNFGVSIVLIQCKADIRIIKLISAVVMLVRPIILGLYVRKKFTFSGDKTYDNTLMKQRWNNLGQSLAFYIHSQTDTIVIMLFLSVEDNSVYTLYIAVIAAIKTVISAITSNYNPIVGRACAERNVANTDMLKVFRRFVQTNSFLTNVLFAVTVILIVPFMRIYSVGFDYNYIQPGFAICLCISEYLYLYRTPYNTLINVNGHFKETQISAFVEAGLNIALSVLLVNTIGLVGVAIGTAIAMAYRMVYSIIYVRKHLLAIPIIDIVKPVLLAAVTVAGVAVIMTVVDLTVIDTYFAFVIAGIIFTLFFSALQLGMHYLAYRNK